MISPGVANYTQLSFIGALMCSTQHDMHSTHLLGIRAANFGPLRQDPMAYQNALASQKNFHRGAGQTQEQPVDLNKLQSLQQLHQIQTMQNMQSNPMVMQNMMQNMQHQPGMVNQLQQANPSMMQPGVPGGMPQMHPGMQQPGILTLLLEWGSFLVLNPSMMQPGVPGGMPQGMQQPGITLSLE